MARSRKEIARNRKEIHAAIVAMPPKSYLMLPAELLNAGALEARKSPRPPHVVYFLWRFTHRGKNYRETLGIYDPTSRSDEPTGLGELSFFAAERMARVLAREHLANLAAGGYPALKATRAREAEEAKIQAEAKAKAEADAKNAPTFADLMKEYANDLERRGRSKQAAREVRSATRLHIEEPWPEIAAIPANKVTPDLLSDVIAKARTERTVTANGKSRQRGGDRAAGKLLTFIKTAFTRAVSARLDTTPGKPFKRFSVTMNPAADLDGSWGTSQPNKNPLSVEELRLYYQLICAVPDRWGAIMQLHLLTGGQRMAQFMRLKTRDISDGSITLNDRKGRQPEKIVERPWSIPLPPKAAAALKACKPGKEWVFEHPGSKPHLKEGALADNMRKAVGKKIPGFSPNRIRSGVETLLAAKDIPREIRGHLQSHGLGGVQDRHYVGYDYMKQKLAALEILERVLTEGAELKRRAVTATINTPPTIDAWGGTFQHIMPPE